MANQPDSFAWNLRRVPETTVIDGESVPHPGRHCAVFVVHGMGDQSWTETSAALRSGFEDALEDIRDWQKKHLGVDRANAGQVPPPFTYEGYWANYADLEATFPDDWRLLNDRERKFFQKLWDRRAFSAGRTYLWILRQQFRLVLDPEVVKQVRPVVRLLYWPLQIIVPAALTLTLIRAPKILTRILADVRLYANPQGMAEEAIVQRIDYRVGTEFLRLIGLGWDFRPLPEAEQASASGARFVFRRVVWVAHSLGTVVSYNVLSDLFRIAAELEQSGDSNQKEGVARFRKSLGRFITMGSPLNKFAALFPKAVRPWPTMGGDKIDRTRLLESGDRPAGPQAGQGNTTSAAADAREWWVNFYHVLDPVSGSLYDPLVCGPVPPVNIHTNWRSSALLPGVAHTSYWSATRVTRFILARTYGRTYLQDQSIRRQSFLKQTWFAVVGYCVWAFLMFGGVVALFWFRAEIRQGLWSALKTAGTFLIGG